MKAKLPQNIKAVSELFAAHGFALYLVGGYVRNAVLGLSGGDYDICSAALPHEAAAIAREAKLTVIEKAMELGTIEIHLKIGGEKHIFEHTTFRRDFYPPGGAHRPYRVTFTQNMQEDALRRDFTIGALYLCSTTGRVFDPTGKGLSDIKLGLLRTAAPDPDETIRDDGLRIMRMARFAAELSFDVAPELLESAQKHAGLLADISAERKRDELVKILLSDIKYPSLGASGPLRGLMLLRQTGALRHVLPRLSEGGGVLQSPQYHQYDVLDHCIHACCAAPPDLVLRLSALLHDIGKPAALAASGKMYGHEIIGETLAQEELEALRFDNRTKNAVMPLIRTHMFDLEAKAKPKTIRRRAVLLGREGFGRLIALRLADVIGSGFDVQTIRSADNWQAELNRMEKEHVPWQITDLRITGHEVAEILGTGPSCVVGQVLTLLHKECVTNPGSNDNAVLKRRAAAYAKHLNAGKILP